jgi:hypothetical protein
MLYSKPNVPLVGVQKPSVVCHFTAAQSVVSCDCGSSVPVVIPGLDRAGMCGSCQTKYVIASLRFANVQGQVTMDVQIGKWHGPMAASFELDLPKLET